MSCGPKTTGYRSPAGRCRDLRDALPDLNRELHLSRSRARFALTNLGSWSSGTYLPMGAVCNRRTGHTMLWQVEHNGAWHWELGEFAGAAENASYVALLGPTDSEHHWRVTLNPGESFETVPVAVAVSQGGLEGAVARLTRYRRVLRRPHEDHRKLPVVFNDFMNTLMGDPSTERLLPLVRAASRAGAEVFCIDSGWYTEIGEGWWEKVGNWEPSKSRFPNGIAEVLDQIRAEGMVPGLWIEPEVVGVRSLMAQQLPPEAFFTRQGERVLAQGRWHLDFRHPRVREHLDKVIDFLVDDLGIGYLKTDYNVNVSPGTESGSVAPGVGLLEHNRALLDWFDGILDRHPRLTIENCASGGMRTDYASAFPPAAPVDQRSAGLLALPADSGRCPGSNSTRTSSRMGLPPARMGRRPDRLHPLQRHARPCPPLRPLGPDDKCAAAPRGPSDRRLQADPDEPG